MNLSGKTKGFRMHNKTSKIPMAQEKSQKINPPKLTDSELFELIQKLELWPAQKQTVDASKQTHKAPANSEAEEDSTINSPKALHKFLNSHQGKALKAYLEKIAFINKKMMDESLHLLIVRDLFKRRLQAQLSLTAKRKKARHAQELNAAYQEAIDKTEQERRKKLAKTHETKRTISSYEYDVSTDYDALIDLLASYKHTRANLEKQLAKEKVLTLSLHKELKNMDVILETLEQKHAVNIAYLDDLDRHLESIDSKNIVALEELMQELLQKKENKNSQIVSLIERNPFAVVEPHLQEQDALNLQIETLKDALDVAEGKKAYLNEHGEEVDSPTKAQFVLKREDKIVKQDNAYFLIKAHESLENLGPDVKAQAEEQFLQMKPTLVPKKRAIHEKHHHEKGKCLHKKALLHKEIMLSEKRQKETQERLGQLNNAEKSIEAQILRITAPQQYKDKVQFLKNSGQTVQREDLLNLVKPLPNAKEATDYLHNEFEKMARGAPIPAPTLKRILETLDTFINKAPRPVPTKRSEEEMNAVSAIKPLSMALKPKSY